MALNSKNAHHQLEAGLPHVMSVQKETCTENVELKESQQRRAASLRRRMLAFWIIVSSPLICLVMTLVISPLFWPGCLSRLHTDLAAYPEDKVGIFTVAVAPTQARGVIQMPEEDALDVARDIPILGSSSHKLARLQNRQDGNLNSTPGLPEEDPSTGTPTSIVEAPSDVLTSTTIESETSTEESVTSEELTSTTTIESTTIESTTPEESTTESTDFTTSTTSTTSTTLTTESSEEAESTTSSGTSTLAETTETSTSLSTSSFSSSSSSSSSTSDPTTMPTSTDEESTSTPAPTSATSTSTEEEEESTTTTEEEEQSMSSSAEVSTRTSTLENGDTTVVTETTWVDVAAPSDDSADASDPDLQNAASRRTTSALFAVPAAALIAVLIG